MKRIKIDRGRATRADQWVRVRVIAVRKNRVTRAARRKAEPKWAWV